MKSAMELFAFLEGVWVLERDIGYSKVTGVAKFTKQGESLLYREDINIDWQGFGNRGYKEYVYSMKGNDLYKNFSTQRQFYKIEMHSNCATGHYHNESYSCDATYIIKDNCFTLIYNISEAGTEYDIITELTRLSSDRDILGGTSQDIFELAH